jgi:hypothetical protein
MEPSSPKGLRGTNPINITLSFIFSSRTSSKELSSQTI